MSEKRENTGQPAADPTQGRAPQPEKKPRRPMDRDDYLHEIRKACIGLGVYRVEFSRARVRLANLYVRIAKLQALIDAGELTDESAFDTKMGPVSDPRLQRLDTLYEKALALEKALGLTADAVRKINPEIFAKDEAPADPFAVMFGKRNAG